MGKGRTSRKRVRRVQIDHRIGNLHRWALVNGFTFYKRFKISCFSEIGRGIAALERITAGSDLLSVPLRSMITVKTAEDDSAFFDMLKDSTELFTCHQMMAFYLSFLIMTDSLEWKTYIDSLPERFTVPYFCDNSKLAKIPVPELHYEIEAQQMLISDAFGRIKDILSKQNGRLSEKFVLPLYEYAFFAVNSRSVYFDPVKLKTVLRPPPRGILNYLSDEPNMAMIPFLDMFNHKHGAETEIDVSSVDGVLHFKLRTCIDTTEYSEIFISYGDHGNLKLLTHYGFTLPTNPLTAVTFTLEDILVTLTDQGIDKRRYEFIKKNGFDRGLYVDGDGYSFNLKILLFVLSGQGQVNTAAIFSSVYSLSEWKKNSETGHRLLEKKMIELNENVKKLTHLTSVTGDNRDEIFENCINLLREYVTILQNMLEYQKLEDGV